MTRAGAILREITSDIEVAIRQAAAESPIDRILQKISKLELPDREHVENYMRHKWRMNTSQALLR